MTYEPIDLHSGFDFQQVVEFLRGLQDREAECTGKEDKGKMPENAPG